MDDIKLTYITTCKGRLHHLKQTLPLVAAQPGISVVVVDYGCPDGTAGWVGSQFPGVVVVKVDEDGFNLARARNLGAKSASSEWLAFFDADVRIASNFFGRLLPQLRASHFYLPRPANPNTWGSCIVASKAIEVVGGYDEAIVGWGGEDNDLYARLKRKGYLQAWYPGQLLEPIRHSDAERTRFFIGKNIDRATRLSHLYRLIKSDYEAISTVPMSFAIRQQLRTALENALQAAANGQPIRQLRLPLPPRSVRTRPQINADLSPKLGAHLVYDLLSYAQEQANEND